MKIATARRLVEAAIVLMILGQVVTWFYAMAGGAAAFLGGLIVLGVQFACSRLAVAHVRYYLYLYISTVFFTVLPIALHGYRLLRGPGKTFLIRLGDFLPLLVEFVLPVILLLAALWCLSPREPNSDARRERIEGRAGA